MHLCVCVSVRVSEREREGGGGESLRDRDQENMQTETVLRTTHRSLTQHNTNADQQECMQAGRQTGKQTCIWMPLLSLLMVQTLMRLTRSSVTRSFMMPWISMFCRPPSRPAVSTSFSSISKCTLHTQQVPPLLVNR